MYRRVVEPGCVHASVKQSRGWVAETCLIYPRLPEKVSGSLGLIWLMGLIAQIQHCRGVNFLHIVQIFQGINQFLHFQRIVTG